MYYRSEKGLTEDSLRLALHEALEGREIRKLLILPPDFT